jgi:aminobenzoyl-glutamate utilization protein B
MYRTSLLIRVFAGLCFALWSDAEISSVDRDAMLESMKARESHFGEISRRIWEFAEVGYKEHKSSALLQDELRKSGFTVKTNIGGAPTAFVAEWGSGKPVIGIIGEFDALPGLSQSNSPERKPLVNGAPGHGCGHNLFGTGSAFAAITVKQWLERNKIPGTIRFYGTPAEEGGGGKIYMIRAGVFKDADAVLDWHPSSSNSASLPYNLANISGKFRFHGKAAHAAGVPHAGRSALDGLLLMNHAVELLREHVPTSSRIHYIITQGGSAPNVVPDFAEGYFYARSPEMPLLDTVWERIVKCAQAGALATETRVEQELVNSVYNYLPNEPLNRALMRHLESIGGIRYTEDEQRFAETLRKSFPPESRGVANSHELVQPFERTASASGSTDSSDVSWNLPVGVFRTATAVPGTPGHSWQNVACAGSSIGRKGMMLAAKVLALTAADLFTTPKLLDDARQDFERRRAGHVYRSRIPEGQKPPLNYRDTAPATM